MITISDLTVSRKTGLTELKDAEMMGHIIGGLTLKPFFRATITLQIPVTIGQISIDLNNNGIIDPNETGPLFSGTFELSFIFDARKQLESEPEHLSMDDCPEDW
ncbi:MAG: hypothetical protein F6K65_25060 [Moorea sp. SIO3C2]|nr:hypothetical protein [Moorena sp. SIO3C2]